MKKSKTSQSNYYAMKKIRTTALMVLSAMVIVAFVGCTKDNDNSNNGGNGGGSYQTKIVGEWELIKYTDLFYDSIGTLILEREFDVEKYENFKFTSEGMVSMDWIWWKSDGIVIATYDIEDDNLKMRYTDCTIEWTIKEMTNSTMVCEEEWFGYEIPNEQDCWEYYDGGRVRNVDRMEFKKVN